MIKLLKPLNQGGVIVDAGTELSLPPDVEAELVKNKLAKPVREKETGLKTGQ